MGLVSSWTPLAEGWETPEGPAFDRDGNLFFVSSDRGAIVRVGQDATAAEFANTGGIPAGLAFGDDGTLYVADSGRDAHGILTVTAGGAVAPLVQAFAGAPFNGCNDLVFDARGVLYFSDPWGSSLERPIGAVYRRFPDGGIERIDAGLAFPNGVAIAPDGSAFFLAETWTNRILRYALDAGGRLGPRTTFAELPGAPGPDGMAFDATGFLFVAHYGEGRLDVLDPGGRLVETIPTPGPEPTNVAFGGPDRRTLVLTEFATRSVYRAEVAVPGHPLFGDAAPAGRARG